MCDISAITRSQAEVRGLARAMRDSPGNLPLLPGIYFALAFRWAAAQALPFAAAMGCGQVGLP